MPEIICQQCHREFHIRPSWVKRARFCSHVCARIGISKDKVRDRSIEVQPRGYRLIKLADRSVTMVSKEDFELLREFNWHRGRSERGYVRCSRLTAKALGSAEIHRVVMARVMGRRLLPAEIVDHVDGDHLNNKRTNLRIVDQKRNRYNQRPQANLKYKGIARNSKRPYPCWTARIHCDGKALHLGTFRSEEEAALAYDTAAIQIFGEYAWLNLIGRNKKSVTKSK